MAAYTPDRWVVITISTPEGDLDRVLGGWYGGYLGSDSWQINSGIERVEEHPDHFLFHGYSGSVYKCYKGSYGLTNLTASVLNGAKDRVICINKYEQETEEDLSE